jgi:CDGSH-type Zn-finger protein
MTREVTHDATKPLKMDAEDVEARGGDIAICQCGLSAEFPFCDGSHRATADEEEGVVYKYEDDDDAKPRHEIVEIVFSDGETDADAEADADD